MGRSGGFDDGDNEVLTRRVARGEAVAWIAGACVARESICGAKRTALNAGEGAIRQLVEPIADVSTSAGSARRGASPPRSEPYTHPTRNHVDDHAPYYCEARTGQALRRSRVLRRSVCPLPSPFRNDPRPTLSRDPAQRLTSTRNVGRPLAAANSAAAQREFSRSRAIENPESASSPVNPRVEERETHLQPPLTLSPRLLAKRCALCHLSL